MKRQISAGIRNAFKSNETFEHESLGRP